MPTNQVIETERSPTEQNGEDEHAAQNPPGLIKVKPNHGKSGHGAEQSTQKKQSKKAGVGKLEIAMCVFTGLSTLAAGAMYFSSTSANRIAESAKQVAIDSANSAKQAVADARTQIRAQVAVTEGQVSWGKGGASLKLTITNTGQTQANDTAISFTVIGFGEYPPLNTALEIKEDAPQTLAAGEKFIFKKTIPFDYREMKEIKSGKAGIYAVGLVNFEDVFGEPQGEAFQLIQGGPYKWDAEFMGVLPLAKKVPSLPQNSN